MKKFKLLALVSLVLITLSSTTFAGFFGFGKKKDKGPKVLDFVVSDDTLEGSPVKKMVEKYNSTHKDVQIRVLEYPYEDARTRVRTMIAAKRPPALMKVTGIEEFFGTMLDLSDIIDKNQYPSLVSQQVSYKNETDAMSLNVTINGLFYNKTLFKKAGVKVPQSEDEIWTWEEFEKALKTVQEKAGARYGLAFDYSEDRWKTMMYQFDGKVFDKDGNPDLNNQEDIKALNYFIHLHEAKIIPEDIWLGGSDSSNLFKTGTIAALFSGSWRILDFSKTIKNFEWGVTYMPKEKRRSTILGGNMLVAFKGSGVEKEAKDFIKWLNENENYTEYCSYGNYLPSRDGINPKYVASAEAFNNLAKERSEIAPNLVNDVIQNSKYKIISNILRKNIVFALQGEKTVEQALTDTEKQISKQKLK